MSKLPNLSSIALGERLGMEQKVAWKLRGMIRKLQVDHPDLLRRIVNGPTADHPRRRKLAKLARKRERANRSELPEASGPPIPFPSAFE
jgi:hypothetical protein